jgi:hypothetical protein
MGSIGGQASGDFKLSTSALRILYSLFKDTISSLSGDGLTQTNPPVSATSPSGMIPLNVKKGVLGGSVAFIRPDQGENTIGGPVLVNAAYVAYTRPLGLFINDAVGNAYENTPGPASAKGPFLRGGACGVKLYETTKQTTNSITTGTMVNNGGVVGTALVYGPGQKLYASINGYLTNDWTDSYEAQWLYTAGLGSSGLAGNVGKPTEPDITCLGTVLAQPDSTSTEMFLELRVA